MKWNWQSENWPEWHYDPTALEALERAFLLGAGKLVGAWSHLSQHSQDELSIELLTDEAMKTSAIEGEYLDRASVQSSMRRAFGLTADRRHGMAESGVADLMADGFSNWQQPLGAEVLFSWHRMVCRGREDLQDIGGWRREGDPMQVVSGPYQKLKVHFEAPPAADMPRETSAFVAWFNDTGPQGQGALPALARAGLAHLYFVSVHPFEDGNGRIARALSEKALAQGIGHPSLVALSRRIERSRKDYYDQLEANNKHMEVTSWLIWFAETVLKAQDHSRSLITHLISKAQVMDRLRGQINERQTKVVLRVYDAGPEGFSGGLSAANYITIAGTSPATARRDLGELVELGVFARTGERKATRYWLKTDQ